jgi:hypothetical protein
MKTSLLGVLSIALLLVTSCGKIVGNGPIITQERILSEFKSVDHNISGELIIVEAAESKVSIEGPDDLIDILKTDVKNETLTITYANNWRIKNSKKVTIMVYGQGLERVHANGSAKVRSLGPIKTEAFEFQLNGSGDLDFELSNCLYVNGKIKGSGNVRLNGQPAKHQTFHISGSGDIDAYNMPAEEVEINISGSGQATVWAHAYLKARIAGSGNIYYYGTPQTDIDISGSGKVVQRSN